MKATDGRAVALIGLGATGRSLMRALARRDEEGSVVAAVDNDPQLAGGTLGAVSGVSSQVPICPSIDDLRRVRPDVAVMTTASRLEEVHEMVGSLVDRGIDVVSLCEELSYPWRTHPERACDLDQRALAGGASILGAGANPGFVMDMLPLLLSAALESVAAIRVERTADLSGFGPLLKKFGFGLAPEQFQERLGRQVVGHIGFEQTLGHLCDRLALDEPDIAVGPPSVALIAETERQGESVRVPAGTVAAVSQRGSASDGSVEIALEETFGILREGDPLRPADKITIEGGPSNVELVAPRGFDSKQTTIAVLANAIGAVQNAPPGLISVSDLPVRALVPCGASE